MIVVDLIIGTREEFEDYFYNEIGVIRWGDEIKDSVFHKIFGYKCEIDGDMTIANQLNVIEKKDPSFGVIMYYDCRSNDEEEEKRLASNAIEKKLTSETIWISRKE